MSVVAAAGFVAGGVHCGVKAADVADLAVVATADGTAVPAAATFTRNRMTAAPVQVSRAHLDATGGRAAAVVLNSGNANAATGGPGRDDAEAMAEATASGLGCAAEEVLVCSTGLIGNRLPMDAILGGIPAVLADRSADGGRRAADAIRTTDTVCKEAVDHGDGFVVGGMAKGSAMLRPDMATMLAVVTTDAVVDADALGDVLRASVETSFNRLTTDGAQSTNDTVIALASGASGVRPDRAALHASVERVCAALARQMAEDAEGATKIVRVEVVGAASDSEAVRGARAVAESQLVKCSWYGKDPYWGRVASELGSAGIAFDQERLAVRYGVHEVARGGVDADHDAGSLAAYMDDRYLEITADLGVGAGRGHVLTVDLTHGYVDENMGTS